MKNCKKYNDKIKKERDKNKKERHNFKRKRYVSFKKTKIGKIIFRILSIFDNKKDNYSFSEVFTITLLSLVIGAFACFSIFTIVCGGRNFFKLSKELNKFYQVYETILDDYYGNVDKNVLIEDAISGMISGVGDIYTSYSNAEMTDSFNELVSGIYEGIGCSIQQLEDGIKVAAVFDNSPAKKAGLEVGDLILKVDNMDVVNSGVDKITKYIREDSSGEVTIIILRDSKEQSIKVKRDQVEMPSVTSEVYEKDGKSIGYIDISVFSAVVANQFKFKLEELEKKKIDGLVIDVRGNNGGYLSAVSSISSMLLPKGKTIYQIQKNDKKTIVNDKTDECRKYPIAILVNNNSASASEILAGAIKESYNGYVVGVTTYGKGTVQQVKKLSDGSMIKYTIENWLSPKGNWINKVGIVPTDEIQLGVNYYSDPSSNNDNQLQKALELVSK